MCARMCTSARPLPEGWSDIYIYIYIHIYANAAPLPEGWSEHQDSSGNVFFFNTATGASTYEHPLDASFKSYYAKLKSA